MNSSTWGQPSLSHGLCERETKKSVQAGTGWRRVSRVICDRRRSARVTGKVYKMKPVAMGGLAQTKRQEEMAEIRNEYIRGTCHIK